MKNRSKVLMMLPGAIDTCDLRPFNIDANTYSVLTSQRMKFDQESLVTMIGDVAVINVHGALMNNISFFEWLLGYNSYSCILAELKNAIHSENVNKIVLDFDSPGGSASEMFELAKYIKKFGSSKPIYGWVGSMACSAAYGLASSCLKVYANPAAEIGSVGVMMVMAHQEQPDMDGNRYVQIVATDSPMKNADPTSEAGMKSHQARLDALSHQFIEMLATNRGVTTDYVKSQFGGGAVFTAREAVDRKMIDGVYATFDEFLATIQNQGGNSMNLQAKNTAPAAKTPVAPKAIETEDAKYHVSSVSVSSAGTGYTVGDVLSIPGGTENATVTVDSVTEEGGLSEITLTSVGTYGSDMSGAIIVEGGTGTGATLDVVMTQEATTTDPVAPSQEQIRQQVLADERSRVASLSDLAVAARADSATLAAAIANGVSPADFSKTLVGMRETTTHISTSKQTEPSAKEAHNKNVDDFAAAL